jgi:hypothetical protein
VEFQEIVMPLDLEDDSLMSMFYKGLNADIKKVLIYFLEAKTFDKLVDQCVSIDQRQFMLYKELKVTERSSVPRSKLPGNNGDGFKLPGNSQKSSYSSTPDNHPSPYDYSHSSSYPHDEN